MEGCSVFRSEFLNERQRYSGNLSHCYPSLPKHFGILSLEGAGIYIFKITLSIVINVLKAKKKYSSNETTDWKIDKNLYWVNIHR